APADDRTPAPPPSPPDASRPAHASARHRTRRTTSCFPCTDPATRHRQPISDTDIADAVGDRGGGTHCARCCSSSCLLILERPRIPRAFACAYSCALVDPLALPAGRPPPRRPSVPVR